MLQQQAARTNLPLPRCKRLAEIGSRPAVGVCRTVGRPAITSDLRAASGYQVGQRASGGHSHSFRPNSVYSTAPGPLSYLHPCFLHRPVARRAKEQASCSAGVTVDAPARTGPIGSGDVGRFMRPTARSAALECGAAVLLCAGRTNVSKKLQSHADAKRWRTTALQRRERLPAGAAMCPGWLMVPIR